MLLVNQLTYNKLSGKPICSRNYYKQKLLATVELLLGEAIYINQRKEAYSAVSASI
nr:MAG TPA: hypothetical protein [Crassvirales sp.]